jgi:hypothetical protein
MTAYFPRLLISLDPLIAEAKRRMRRRRVWIVASLILIGGLTAAVASIATSGGPGSTGGGSGAHGLLSQVRSSFGDHRLVSASVNGRMLTVKVAAHDEPSSVSATFEAQMLASALHDAQAERGRTPIDSVRFVDADGKAIPGYGPATVGGGTSPPPLGGGACKAAAQGVQTSSMVIQSALTLPYAGGACAFTFQTSDRSGFAAGILGYKLISPLGGGDQRSVLWEVDDQAGVPLFVDAYTPGGGGVSYVKPGSGILFGP